MIAHSRSARGILAVFAAILSLLIASIPVGATGYAYRADIAPGGAAAGTTTTLVMTIKQLSSSSSQKVRSARVSAPDGITIDQATVKKGSSPLTSGVVATSGSVTVNSVSLNVNQTLTFTLKVAIPCGEYGTKTWGVIGQNGTTFDPDATALSRASNSQRDTTVAKCSLSFLEQPASAGRDDVITSVTADPSGTPIKVRLLDGNGDPTSQSGVTVELARVSGTGASGATLGGDISDPTNSNGVAVFAPTLDISERGYRLEASASGIIGSGSSSAFNIDDVAKVCSGSCSGSSERGDTTATINASTNGGVLTMSLGLDQVDCNDAANNFYVGSSSAVTFDVTPTNARTVITIRLDAAAVDRPYNLYDVCFSAPSYGFRNRYNVRIDPGEAGLLKICPPRLDKQNADPCVVDKWRENGDVLIKFSVPPGDPRGRI